jgi:hypothetical protein
MLVHSTNYVTEAAVVLIHLWTSDFTQPLTFYTVVLAHNLMGTDTLYEQNIPKCV